jgi:hypothetical protein
VSPVIFWGCGLEQTTAGSFLILSYSLCIYGPTVEAVQYTYWQYLKMLIIEAERSKA